MSEIKASHKVVDQTVLSRPQREGRGAIVRRSIGTAKLPRLDPFLMLDEFSGDSREGAGFPDHPHRGFETVSYLLEGSFVHEDFCGHKGVLKAGSLQWMTAGRGIVHSEMPGPEPSRGLQLWVNLKREYKMVPPKYQEMTAEEIVSKKENGVLVKVIAGESMGVTSAIRTLTPTSYLDFTVDPGAEFSQPISKDWTSFAYTLDEPVTFGSTRVEGHHTVVFSKAGDQVYFKNEGSKPARFVLFAGQPIREPVVQHGPFVMTTQDEIQQAIADYTSYKNGFENARNWQSVEGNK